MNANLPKQQTSKWWSTDNRHLQPDLSFSEGCIKQEAVTLSQFLLARSVHVEPVLNTVAQQQLFLRMASVKIEIQFKHADTWFAEEPELAAERMFGNQPTNVGFRHVAFARYPRNLEFSGRRRDFRV